MPEKSGTAVPPGVVCPNAGAAATAANAAAFNTVLSFIVASQAS
jgi:hypothetical protein